MKRKIIIGSLVLGAPAVGLLLAARVLYPANVAATAPDHAEEILRTRRYRTDLPTFVAETESIIPTLTTWGRNWKHVSTEKVDKIAGIKAEVPVVVFTDNLQVSAERDAAGGIRVDVRSNSRAGKSDFGENRRHVLQILEALDAKFAK
ncbi:MAG TPA: DUF1499 domain-containing protein [Pyrinomonadaceae bacterium]